MFHSAVGFVAATNDFKSNQAPLPFLKWLFCCHLPNSFYMLAAFRGNVSNAVVASLFKLIACQSFLVRVTVYQDNKLLAPVV